MADDNKLLEVYKQLNAGYHAVDDFRAKLLGFLPLASGVAFICLLDPAKASSVTPHLKEIGIAGMLVTLGLLIYELKGIMKCTDFIFSGKAIEEKLLVGSSLSGKFSELAKEKNTIWGYVTEPVASAIVYATVMAGWAYVAFYRSNIWPSLITWIAVVIIVIVFWIRYMKVREKTNDQK